MSELHQIEDALTAALDIITECWDELIESSDSGSGGVSSSDEVTALDRRVSLRHEVAMCLNGWARVIVEDRNLTHWLPLGTDVPGLIVLLKRHAQWFSGHEAARDALCEIQGWAGKVLATARPKQREWVYLGDCPFVVEDWFCHGQVRARIGGDDVASCSDCGQEAVILWWEDVLRIEALPQAVTAPALVEILYHRLHVRTTARTLHNWLRDGLIHAIEAFGPQPLHPRYDPWVVMSEVAQMGRACPVCGRFWQGFGDTCLACFTALAKAEPGRAVVKEHPEPPHSLLPRPGAPLPGKHGLALCGYSDLPASWCACDYHRRVS